MAHAWQITNRNLHKDPWRMQRRDRQELLQWAIQKAVQMTLESVLFCSRSFSSQGFLENLDKMYRYTQHE